jgi:hypothetical protein
MYTFRTFLLVRSTGTSSSGFILKVLINSTTDEMMINVAIMRGNILGPGTPWLDGG